MRTAVLNVVLGIAGVAAGAVAVTSADAAGAAGAAATAAAPACSATSTATPPRVVELYTSEGCSSCPPADRWLSTLKGRADVVALAFHVDYWDRLGWTDRYASREATDRQHRWAQRLRAAHVYTPQVIADGRDWRGWPAWPSRPSRPAAGTSGAATAPTVVLARDGDMVTARIAAVPGAADAGRRYAGYWAVVEDGHVSRVGAGENAGATLRHDHVVRLLRDLPEFAADAGAQSTLSVSRGVAAHPRRVVLVVSDAASGRPLQAVSLAC